jgi:hypothetical protein
MRWASSSLLDHGRVFEVAVAAVGRGERRRLSGRFSQWVLVVVVGWSASQVGAGIAAIRLNAVAI